VFFAELGGTAKGVPVDRLARNRFDRAEGLPNHYAARGVSSGEALGCETDSLMPCGIVCDHFEEATGFPMNCS
jgi:hypothetical protein